MIDCFVLSILLLTIRKYFEIYRYFATFFPLKSKKFNTRGNIKTAVIIITVSAFFLTLPLVKMSVVSVYNFMFLFRFY